MFKPECSTSIRKPEKGNILVIVSLCASLLALGLAAGAIYLAYPGKQQHPGEHDPLADYDLSTPQDSLRSFLKMKKTDDAHALQAYRELSSQNKLDEKLNSLTIHRTLDSGSQKLLFVSYRQDGREVRSVFSFRQDGGSGRWMKQELNVNLLDNVDHAKEIREWLKSGEKEKEVQPETSPVKVFLFTDKLILTRTDQKSEFGFKKWIVGRTSVELNPDLTDHDVERVKEAIESRRTYLETKVDSYLRKRDRDFMADEDSKEMLAERIRMLLTEFIPEDWIQSVNISSFRESM